MTNNFLLAPQGRVSFICVVVCVGRKNHTVHENIVSQVNKKSDTHTRAGTGRTSHKNSGSSHTGRSCRMDGRGDHMAGSCTPDWTSYLEQQRTKLSEHSIVSWVVFQRA